MAKEDRYVAAPVQKVAPSPVVKEGERLAYKNPYEDAAADYLQGKGWTKAGYNDKGEALWDDPIPRQMKNKVMPTVQLPIQGGGKETINQLVAQPVPWAYNTQEAMRLQKHRDTQPLLLKDLIAQRELELEELRERYKEQLKREKEKEKVKDE